MKAKLALVGSGVLAFGAAGAVFAQSAAPVGAITAGTARPGQAPVTSCERLAAVSLPQAENVRARSVPAGPFTPPGSARGSEAVNLGAYCAVTATLKPSPDSDITMVLWLPDSGWNGKFMMVGNEEGWSGSIPYAGMVEPLRRGYAVAATDTGHRGDRGSFAFGHPEKLIDFAYRAVHETAVKGKALINAYYGGTPRYSYWDGCSAGGRQGLKETQMYPADFDGVIAGAPANNWTRQQARTLAAEAANQSGGASAVLGPDQFKVLHQAVLEQCDAADLLKDGQLQDPRGCGFRASSVVCKSGQESGACLTPAQAAVADQMYAPLRDPLTDAMIFPGMPPGSEMGWGEVISARSSAAADTFALAAGDRNWDAATLDLSADLPNAEAADAGIAAVSPDLSAFRARGGKIIQYHGWADAVVPAENSVNYYESVVTTQGGMAQTRTFYRLFLVPAMGHCGGSYEFDWITSLEQWVEQGQPPDLVLADHIPLPGVTPAPPPPGAVVFAPEYGVRTMCAYPQVARFQGRQGGGMGPGPYDGNRLGELPLEWICQTARRGARFADSPGELGAAVPISP